MAWSWQTRVYTQPIVVPFLIERGWSFKTRLFTGRISVPLFHWPSNDSKSITSSLNATHPCFLRDIGLDTITLTAKTSGKNLTSLESSKNVSPEGVTVFVRALKKSFIVTVPIKITVHPLISAVPANSTEALESGRVFGVCSPSTKYAGEKQHRSSRSSRAQIRTKSGLPSRSLTVS